MAFALAHWTDHREVLNTDFSDSKRATNSDSEDPSNSCKTLIPSFVQRRRLRDYSQERTVRTRTLSPATAASSCDQACVITAVSRLV